MRLSLLLAGLVPLALTPLAAQERGGFVTRLGADTVSIEQFTRTGNRLEGTIVARAPRVTVRTYVTEVGADGRATRSEVTLRYPGETTPVQVGVATFTRDSVMVEVRRDTAVQRRRIALAGAALVVPTGPNQSWAITEFLAERLRASRTDSVLVPAYLVGGAGGFTIEWVRAGRDSVRIRATGGAEWRGRLGRNGRLESTRPIAGTQLFAAERIGTADVMAVAAAWRAREQASAPAGILSPRDTVRATVAGASLMVDYGRPSKRGRELFGTPVAPWGEVWRTGANAATQFRTDRDLDIGGVRLPAGFYTLWTRPTPAGWTLIINAQTGQWGTAHDPARDIFHLPMQVTQSPAVVEQFTIRVVPEGQGGVLVVEWDRVRAAIPFTVRPN